MAYLDCAVSTSILGKDAICNVAPVQEPNISLNTPSHVPIYTMQSLLLRLKKLPYAAKRAFLVKDMPQNLVAVSELVDSGCSVHMYFWGFGIDYEGETIYKGWRERGSRLFRMNLDETGGSMITPIANLSKYSVEAPSILPQIGAPTASTNATTRNSS